MNYFTASNHEPYLSKTLSTVSQLPRQESNSLKIAIYARHRDEAKANSQIAVCEARIATYEKHCEQQVELLSKFVDNGLDANKPYSERPGYQALLEEARNQTFTVLLVTEVNRISRNFSEVLALDQYFKAIEIRITTILEQPDFHCHEQFLKKIVSVIKNQTKR